MGIAYWCLPLVSTITPATLTIISAPVTKLQDRIVPYIDRDWKGSTAVTEAPDSGAVTTWLDASPVLRRLLSASAFSLSNLALPPPAINSSYTIQMYGPAISCRNSTSAEISYTSRDPDPQYEYQAEQFNGSSGAGSLIQPLIVLWNFDQTPDIGVSCDFFNASYIVQFEFLNGVQTTNIINQTAHGGILDMNLYPVPYTDDTVCIDDTSLSLSAKSLESFPIRKPCNQNISTSAAWAYYSIARVYLDLRQGNISVGSTAQIFTTTQVLSTAIAGCAELNSAQETMDPSSIVCDTNGGNNCSYHNPYAYTCRNESLKLTLEELMTNFTLSMLSSSEMVALSINYTTKVLISNNANFYMYDSQNLLISYAAAIGVTLLAILLGTWAFLENGISTNSSFSTFLLTTRNQSLDNLARDHSLGSQPLDKMIGKTRLRFGVLENADSVGRGEMRVGFGLQNEVTRLQKGEVI